MATCSNYYDENEQYSDSNSSEYSNDSDCSSSVTSSSYEDYEPIWTDEVRPNGDLFYFEPLVYPSEETELFPTCKNKDSTIRKEIVPDPSKSKTTKKIAKWMKHRQKKIKNHFIQKKKSTTQVSRNTSVKESASTSRFNCPDIGEVKEVILDVDVNRYNYGRRASLAERLFGLVVVPFDHQGTDTEERLMVKEIVPHNESYKEGTIQVGDWLKSVDDKIVTVSNFSAVLESISSPKQVKLVICRLLDKNSSLNESVKVPTSTNSLLDHLIGHDQSVDKIKLKYSSLPHAIYYLSISTDSSAKDDDDIAYSYPDGKGVLSAIKGMYVTLAHMIGDVGTPPVLSCNVLVDDETVGLSFMIEGDYMMILALPSSRCTAVELHHFATDVGKILKLQFQSLSHAFCDSDNKEYLDSFFAHFFHRILNSFVNGMAKSHLMQVLPSVHWFPLASDLKIVVDDILTQFESADFGDDSEGFYGNRRIYHILGSCLFHKGYLLGSHLYKDDLLDIGLFLKYHGLLTFTKTHRVSRSIAWKEIFPSRRQNKLVPEDPVFVEADGRYFMLIVAMKYNILATILEAGGFALDASGYSPPEPFYVEQVEGTLMLLEESGIFPVIGKLLEAQDPPLASSEAFLKQVEKSGWEKLTSIVGLNNPNPLLGRSLDKRSISHSNLSFEGNKKFSETFSVLKKSQYGEGDFERQQLLSHMGPADGESDEENAVAPDWSSSAQRRLRRNSTSTSSNTGSHCSEDMQANVTRGRYNSLYDVRGYSSQDHLDTVTLRDSVTGTQLVTGYQNSLFYYVHMDPTEGVFLAPTSQSQKMVSDTFAKDIIQNFYKCCLHMRTTFESSLRNKQLLSSPVLPKFEVNGFLQAVCEQGALFQLQTLVGDSSKKSTLVLTFWVIGRLFFAPEPREVYVCYHDSIPQDVVEMAFRLGYGVLL